jgi:molybdopterin molybdotransferase
VSESSLSAKREPAALTTVAEARAAMLAGIAVSQEEFVPLAEALGRVLAQPVTTRRDQPPFAVSEMDGYAVIAADTPASLILIGESAAGHGFAGRVTQGSTVRISTGAAVPEGADAVVIQENVLRAGNIVEVPRAENGQHIRPRGMDFTAGTTLLEAGRKLDGIVLALAAASGVAKLPVRRSPRVAILSGGDELAEPGSEPGPFQIFDSGTHGIAALVTAWGGTPHRLQLEKDDLAAIARAAEKGLKENDLLVLVGGASVGDHDHARPALQKLGLEMMVNKVALRPGKPTWFGHALQRPVLGLPGNPASALVCAHIFLRPLLAAMLGRDASVTPRRARLLEALPANGGREHYLRAHLAADAQGVLTVRAFEQQDSSLLSIFAAANALIRLPAGAAALEQGALVDALPLDQC